MESLCKPRVEPNDGAARAEANLFTFCRVVTEFEELKSFELSEVPPSFAKAKQRQFSDFGIWRFTKFDKSILDEIEDMRCFLLFLTLINGLKSNQSYHLCQRNIKKRK